MCVALSSYVLSSYHLTPPRSPLFPYTTLFRSQRPARPASAGDPRHRVDRTHLRARRQPRKTAPTAPLPSPLEDRAAVDRKSTRLNSSHPSISYAVFCLKKKKITTILPHAVHRI